MSYNQKTVFETTWLQNISLEIHFFFLVDIFKKYILIISSNVPNSKLFTPNELISFLQSLT